MAGISFAEILDGQDIVFPSAPAALRTGSFRIHWIPLAGSADSSIRPLVFIDGELQLRVEHVSGNCRARVYAAAGLRVESANLTFPATTQQQLVRLTFTLDAVTGSLTVEGATTGNGTTTGTPWSAADGTLRLGSDDSSNYALGWLSQPLGLQTDPPLD